MALLNCPECGKEISDRASVCPNCGAPVAKKYCQHCGEQIDKDCVICPKCGKQVQDLRNTDKNIIINNSTSSSSSSGATSSLDARYRKVGNLPWYLSAFWIFVFGCFTGGIYWIIGIIMRINWRTHN